MEGQGHSASQQNQQIGKAFNAFPTALMSSGGSSAAGPAKPRLRERAVVKLGQSGLSYHLGVILAVDLLHIDIDNQIIVIIVIMINDNHFVNDDRSSDDMMI
jgi:hypothetical protein